ncbi:MAG: PilZ domain-containing protein [Leptospirales bacterium]|jgi:hypothetical protein
MTQDAPDSLSAKLKTAKDYVRDRSLDLIAARESGGGAAGSRKDDNRRREPRMLPAEYQFAVLSPDLTHFEKTGALADHGRRYAIVLDISEGGCSLVLELGSGQDPAFPALNQSYALILDGRPPVRAIVRWRGRIDETLINAGFEFQP